MAKQPLTLNVFIHEDLSEYSRYKLYETHLSWFTDEMQNLSGRKLTVNMFSPSEAKSLSNFDYRNSSADVSLGAWKEKLIKHFGELLLDAEHTHFNKYLLLTRHAINSRVSGIATLKHYAGIASITTDMTPAHEAGHMFGATHEDSEVLYNGWWSETVMRPESSPFRSDANRFSDKNRENIRKYLDAEISARPVPRPEDDWD